MRISVFFIMLAFVLGLSAAAAAHALLAKQSAQTYATTLTGIPYSNDTLYLRFGGLNGYFSGHYQFPGAYVMQKESFVYSVKEKMR